MTIHVVLGPPLAGKLAYVRAERKDGDVVVDFDLLAQALGSSKAYDAKGSVRTVTSFARWAVISKILDGITADAWIIHTSPQRGTLQAYADKGASFKVINPGEAAVMARAKAQRVSQTVLDAISRWYANPPEIPRRQPKRTVVVRLK